MAWTLAEINIEPLALAIGASKAIGSYLVKKAWEKVSNKTCMIPTCQRLSSVNLRGLCMMCYSNAKKKVETGETTWEKLVELGLAQDKQANDPFNDAYSKAMKDVH